MHIDFSGRTIIVTGGTGALGGAVVKSFLDAGARVVVTYVIEEEVAPFLERIVEQKYVDLYRCDVRLSLIHI